MSGYFAQLELARALMQRGFAAIYLVAFVNAGLQFPALLGERGLLPVPAYVARRRWREAPSLFLWGYSDGRLHIVAWTGAVLAALALTGVAAAGPMWLGIAVWLAMWFLYLSVVNVGQTFYGFGWESMLLEVGFFAAFLGPGWMQAPLIPVLILRWMLFRTEVGAGLIKLRHDACWRDLTCLYYHYETQPLPNPLSWYFHQIPRPWQRLSVLFSHVVQIAVPFGLFAPQPVAAIAGALIILHQLLLIVSGNYSWLNWLTVVLGFSALTGWGGGGPAAIPAGFAWVLYGLAAVTAGLSVQPTLNLFSRRQAMNRSYNPLHLVNSYGAFGSVTRVRYEIVIEGTEDVVLTSETVWRAYECKGKPGEVGRRPPQVAPYHLRLDWMLWFLPFSVRVSKNGLSIAGHEAWFVRLMRKLLEADRDTLRLLSTDPFAGRRPRFVRAQFYRYRFTTAVERRHTGAWWVRDLVGSYFPESRLA